MGHTTLEKADSLKATVENPRGSVEKLSPEGTVIPLCPKDFQQLLRLPNS
jgi:hypothetical protein